MSACEMVREKAVKILNKEEIEGMKKVCRVGCMICQCEIGTLTGSSLGKC